MTPTPGAGVWAALSHACGAPCWASNAVDKATQDWLGLPAESISAEATIPVSKLSGSHTCYLCASLAFVASLSLL